MEALTEESEFTVKESTLIDLLVAAVFFCMVASSVTYNSGSKVFDRLMLFGLVPGIIFTIKAFVKTTAITVNKKGIWFANQPVTDWQNFISAKVNQLEMLTGRWEDRNELAVEYFKGTEGDVYKKSIMLVSTQNKSEEEIIAAITFFYELYKKNNNPLLPADL